MRLLCVALLVLVVAARTACSPRVAGPLWLAAAGWSLDTGVGLLSPAADVFVGEAVTTASLHEPVFAAAEAAAPWTAVAAAFGVLVALAAVDHGVPLRRVATAALAFASAVLLPLLLVVMLPPGAPHGLTTGPNGTTLVAERETPIDIAVVGDELVWVLRRSVSPTVALAAMGLLSCALAAAEWALLCVCCTAGLPSRHEVGAALRPQPPRHGSEEAEGLWRSEAAAAAHSALPWAQRTAFAGPTFLFVVVQALTTLVSALGAFGLTAALAPWVGFAIFVACPVVAAALLAAGLEPFLPAIAAPPARLPTDPLRLLRPDTLAPQGPCPISDGLKAPLLGHAGDERRPEPGWQVRSGGVRVLPALHLAARHLRGAPLGDLFLTDDAAAIRDVTRAVRYCSHAAPFALYSAASAVLFAGWRADCLGAAVLGWMGGRRAGQGDSAYVPHETPNGTVPAAPLQADGTALLPEAPFSVVGGLVAALSLGLAAVLVRILGLRPSPRSTLIAGYIVLTAGCVVALSEHFNLVHSGVGTGADVARPGAWWIPVAVAAVAMAAAVPTALHMVTNGVAPALRHISLALFLVAAAAGDAFGAAAAVLSTAATAPGGRSSDTLASASTSTGACLGAAVGLAGLAAVLQAVLTWRDARTPWILAGAALTASDEPRSAPAPAPVSPAVGGAREARPPLRFNAADSRGASPSPAPGCGSPEMNYGGIGARRPVGSPSYYSTRRSPRHASGSLPRGLGAASSEGPASGSLQRPRSALEV